MVGAGVVAGAGVVGAGVVAGAGVPSGLAVTGSGVGTGVAERELGGSVSTESESEDAGDGVGPPYHAVRITKENAGGGQPVYERGCDGGVRNVRGDLGMQAVMNLAGSTHE